jgi:hypothetical protein
VTCVSGFTYNLPVEETSSKVKNPNQRSTPSRQNGNSVDGVNLRMNNILVVGSMNADLVVRSPRLPGETISGEDLQIIPGGRAPIKLSLRRQGASVSMIGRVGMIVLKNSSIISNEIM